MSANRFLRTDYHCDGFRCGAIALNAGNTIPKGWVTFRVAWQDGREPRLKQIHLCSVCATKFHDVLPIF